VIGAGGKTLLVDTEPDPRLGTYEDLRRALAACHEMGTSVYFFVNYHVWSHGACSNASGYKE
jgi:hypothetical protein